MSTVNIPEADSVSYREFQEGNPVQVRAVASPGQEREFEKGKQISISHQNMKATAVIVSDPIEITNQSESGRKVFSLIVEKT
ncbi:MAG TPA: hypothetical protein VIN08_02560 [Ohtaekwangia sp.]|uniref:hypothetical protein n=1 Tax=Ohtaekwangia sp. TaxID=2066019 RepID=UPI002F9476C7